MSIPAGHAEGARLPQPALERLASYMRCLIELEQAGAAYVSSQELENITGVSAAQLRKDLSYLGELGKRGIGYDVARLRERIAEVLDISHEQNVLLVGAGRLGSALLAYPGWRLYRFRIAAVFDRDPKIIGTTIRRLKVRSIDEVVEANEEFGARIGILAVPAWEAQNVADRLVAAGVRGLINFAPARLQAPPEVKVREVCFICELAILSYQISDPAPPAEGDAAA